MRVQSGAILAIDLGTSAVKVLIVSTEGQILGRSQASYTTLHPREGFDEQHIDDWWQAIVSATSGVRRFAPNAAIGAIAITGQMHGTVLLDRQGAPLHPAIIWSDRRTTEVLRDVEAQLGADLPILIGGPIGTGYQSLTLAWMQRHRPRIRESIAHVLLPVDLVGFLLTGAMATDPSNAVSTGLLNASSGDWEGRLLDAFDIPRAWLPRIVASGSSIGDLGGDSAAALDLPAGIPVFHGGGDAPAAAIGGNVLTHAAAMIIFSTGAQVIRPIETYAPEPEGRWHTWPSALPPDASGDRWLSVGAMLNAGRAIDWIHRAVAPGIPLADLIALAESAPTGSSNLLFLPYLAGERSPLLDPHARGAFIGLSDSHEPHHLARAVIEGIALSVADTLDRMAPGADRPSHIVFGGGGSSPAVRQIVSNVLGAPLSIPPAQECSALGAARTVAHSLGWTSLHESQPWGQKPGTTVQPALADLAFHEERLAIFRDAVACTLPIVHRLQRIQP